MTTTTTPKGLTILAVAQGRFPLSKNSNNNSNNNNGADEKQAHQAQGGPGGYWAMIKVTITIIIIKLI